MEVFMKENSKIICFKIKAIRNGVMDRAIAEIMNRERKMGMEYINGQPVSNTTAIG
jgi:hypothetical protein